MKNTWLENFCIIYNYQREMIIVRIIFIIFIVTFYAFRINQMHKNWGRKQMIIRKFNQYLHWTCFENVRIYSIISNVCYGVVIRLNWNADYAFILP